MMPANDPLAFRGTIAALRGRRLHAQHPGMLLQRYLAPPATGDNADNKEKCELFRAAIAAAQSAALGEMYTAAFDRWNASFNDGGVHVDMELATGNHSRLIVGLGCENVLETGIRLHHTYGLPLLPGSALKGLASHYCAEVWGRSEPSAGEAQLAFGRGGAYHNLLFGTCDDSGVIAFHDAWLTPASLKPGALHLDVMTPHHQSFQLGPGDKFRAPTDFDSPVPVAFLSVSGAFRVRLSWRGPAESPPELARDWTKLAGKLLREALVEWGIGGKTSSGYGRLGDRPNPQTTSQALHYAPPAALPSVGEWADAELLAERTKKGGWRARHVGSGIAGPIQNSGDVPADKKAGDKPQLIVTSANAKEISFRYPMPADEQKRAVTRSAPKNRGGKQQGGSSKGGGRGRR